MLTPEVVALAALIPEAWRPITAPVTGSARFAELAQALALERAGGAEIFPPEAEVFTALALTAPEKVKVVILGQDPYHDTTQAHGLAFSVRRGVKPPPSLVNIFKELAADQDVSGAAMPRTNGELTAWAKNGVLLLNTVLTVAAHRANSHRNRGWEEFTDAIIAALGGTDLPGRRVFILWGAPAEKKARLIAAERHLIITSPHPSPLSAYRGFFGSRPFSRANEFLRAAGEAPVDWSLESDTYQRELF